MKYVLLVALSNCIKLQIDNKVAFHRTASWLCNIDQYVGSERQIMYTLYGKSIVRDPVVHYINVMLSETVLACLYIVFMLH